MYIDELQVDLDSIAQQARQTWWGPSLSAVISEIESCREHPAYLFALVHGSTDSQQATQLVIAHCEARARVDLLDSLHLAVRRLGAMAEPSDFIVQLMAIRRLVREYFRGKPCSHAELLFHMALLGLENPTEEYQKIRFLQHLLKQLTTIR